MAPSVSLSFRLHRVLYDPLRLNRLRLDPT